MLSNVFLSYSNFQKDIKYFHPPTSKYYVSVDVKFCEQVSYFSRDISLAPPQGKLNSNNWIKKDVNLREDLAIIGKGVFKCS